MKIEKDYKVLVDKYGFKYGFNCFSSYLGFWGPFYAYSFYNEYGCFTVMHAFQRNEIEYFMSKQFSDKQEILFEKLISEQIFLLLRDLRRNPRNWFKRDDVLLAEYFVDQIEKWGNLFGIKVKKQ